MNASDTLNQVELRRERLIETPLYELDQNERSVVLTPAKDTMPDDLADVVSDKIMEEYSDVLTELS